MKASFLTHPISEKTPSYGNRDKISLKPNNQISKGDTANTTEIHITNNHIGTHIDVPKHFYDDGKTITDINVEDWFFNSISLIDIPCEEAKLIEVDDLLGFGIKKTTDFLIMRTGYESKRQGAEYWNSYPGISPEACEYLRAEFSDLRAIGFDFISLTSPLYKDAGKQAHRVLLDNRDGKFVFIIEDMKLSHLEETPKKIQVSPLLLEKGNGGPVTVFGILK